MGIVRRAAVLFVANVVVPLAIVGAIVLILAAIFYGAYLEDLAKRLG